VTKPAETVQPAVTTLLADDPSETDEFRRKAHEQVAHAIAGLAGSIGREPGGKVIGLEGSWGSGKSTVVQLLCAELKKTAEEPTVDAPETHPIIFDA
jgi:tRNA A37 threonylcarbamoyladenosine biosynthesis protein TsaE